MGGGDCLSGSGTEASHWEKRVMLGELMVGTASSGNRAIISDLTLAVFADSGWFEPVYDVQAPRCFYNSGGVRTRMSETASCGVEIAVAPLSRATATAMRGVHLVIGALRIR